MDIDILSLKKIKNLLFKIVKQLLALFFLSSLAAVLLLRFVPVYATPLMALRFHQQHRDGTYAGFCKQWTPIEDIAPDMVVAAVAAEDANFMTHNGFDWEAIEKAAQHNKKSDKLRGGSTISQQTAKNVFLWPGRSWVRKGLEGYFTVLIEFFWPKKRIMEVYLNVVETGPGVYGVEAASRKYFGKPAKLLSRNQAATIAAALRWPLQHDVAHPDQALLTYRWHIKKNMRLVEQHTNVNDLLGGKTQ